MKQLLVQFYTVVIFFDGGEYILLKLIFLIIQILYIKKISICLFEKYCQIFLQTVCLFVCLYINLCRLFNAKSIFIQINSSILNNSV